MCSKKEKNQGELGLSLENWLDERGHIWLLKGNLVQISTR